MDSRRTDTLIAVGSLVAIVPATYANLSWTGPYERPLDPAGLALITIAALSLAFRRSAPLAAGIVAAACGVVYYAAHYPGVFAAAPALASIYTLAVLGRRGDAIWLALGLAVPVYGLMALSSDDPAAGNWMMLLSGWLVAMVVVGEVTRGRRAYLHAVEQRAEAQAERARAEAQRAEAMAQRAEAEAERAREAERSREEAALRRAGEERLWIAQELHDSLTHSISVVNVQAALAMELLERRPERVREALAAIRESGQEAMHELRATLGVLRQSEPEGAEAGLAGLPRLLSRAEGAGLRVAHTVAGDPYVLPPEVDRAAYRIAQEALTNVLRHAGAAAVTVAVAYDRAKVVLLVENDGEPGTPGPGMGLIGMRERAVAVGGCLTAGPGEHGGFTVRAELPSGAAA
ncbi:sensor histidine kinase [Nonomuraea sp. FMUSA5-5]|uniref:histidine kinase n=1 Tax=Nonomuraea composti TaxID=2720023 RepID=A0ABX1BNM2_9ACTN|nr:histidine kinase [Nonomuraea sp. FMUSA5-5]NJP97411.1 sensor histidine kinase [Nonomuraea sp. FMUSA5-5]